MMIEKYTTIDDELVDKIENKKLSKQELKNIEVTLKEDFPEYWKWRSKYNTFGMMAIVLGIIEVFLVLVLFGIIPLVEIAPKSEAAERLVFGLIIVFVLFFITNLITAFFAYKFSFNIHVNHLLKLMKKYYPQELVDFDIPGSMGINLKDRKRGKK